ncbi:MAG: hypothetical protein GY797_09940 [Deltaproteobacteria bacterium]|nr:hypothetical protein [Deltaproteobacteria bacterium]
MNLLREKQAFAKRLKAIQGRLEKISTAEQQEETFAMSTDSDGKKIYFPFAVKEQWEKLEKEYDMVKGHLQVLNSL